MTFLSGLVRSKDIPMVFIAQALVTHPIATTTTTIEGHQALSPSFIPF